MLTIYAFGFVGFGYTGLLWDSLYYHQAGGPCYNLLINPLPFVPCVNYGTAEEIVFGIMFLTVILAFLGTLSLAVLYKSR